MAEIGLIASVIGIVAAGTKLSITIFDFAAGVARAGTELQHVGTEITNLCAVFERLQAVLQHAHFQPSAPATQTLTRIIDRCTEVFSEIEDIVAKLQTVRGKGEFPTADFAAKVKWAFSGKAKVMVLRTTLESCKSTLSLMLSTMQLAETVSQRRDFTELSLAEYEQHNTVLQCLVISQQCAVEELEFYEDKAEKEDEVDMRLPANPAVDRTNSWNRRRSRGRLVQMFSGLSLITNLPTPAAIPESRPTRADRASIWLDAIVAPEDEPADPHPGVQRKKRLSSVGTQNAPMQLLRKWTDQGENFDPRPRRQQTFRSDMQPDLWRDSEFSFSSCDTLPGAESVSEAQHGASTPRQGILKRPTDLISPKTARVQSIGFHLVAGVDGTLEASGEVTEWIESDDNYDAILRSILEDHCSTRSSDEVALCISYSGKVKVLKSSDKPLEMLKQLEELELDPRFFIRTRA